MAAPSQINPLADGPRRAHVGAIKNLNKERLAVMARYFGIGSARDVIAYNMERCEEVVLIDSYLKIRDRMQKTDAARVEFEGWFLVNGQGVASPYIKTFNFHLKRLGLPELVFRETDIYEYGRNPDKAFKARERAKIMVSLEKMPDAAREKIVDAARAEMETLSPPHKTWLDLRDEQERRDEDDRITQREQERRRLALNANGSTKPTATPLSPDVAQVLLGATDDEALREAVLSRIDRDGLLALLAQINDQSLKNRIVKRMLEA